MTPEEREAYEALKADNHERFDKILQRGVSVAPQQMLALQVEAIMDLLGPEFREMWQMRFEERVANLLTEAEKQIPASQLVVPAASGLVVP
jgi:hypothetical protein